MKNNFADTQVAVVECPDLTKEPFLFPVKGNKASSTLYELYALYHIVSFSHALATFTSLSRMHRFYFLIGLCGKPRITDVGGVPYLVPLVQKDKVVAPLHIVMYGDKMHEVIFYIAYAELFLPLLRSTT